MYENQRLESPKSKLSFDGIIQMQIASFLPDKLFGQVLDYGAGNSPYRGFIKCEKYITLDIQQNINNDIDFIIESNQFLPFGDDSFDLIIIMDVIEHTDNIDFVLQEVKRILKPNGSLIISVPFIYREHETPYDFTRLTYYGLTSLINKYQGYPSRVQKIGNWFYTLTSIFLERGVHNGELNKLSKFGVLLNRLIHFTIPFTHNLLNKPCSIESGVYHHLVMEVRFD